MKILVADDDAVSLLYLEDALQDWGYEVLTTNDGATACRILQQPDAPVIAILDWMMPGMDGIDICRSIRDAKREKYTYLIMLTSRSATEFVVEAMNAGADDFISKPFNIDELEVRVRAGRRIAELESQLRLKANHDALTGLYNHGAIIDMLQRELARRRRGGQPISIIFADLDHSKQINDTYGHLAGDEVLREIARRIPKTLRPYDLLGRYGGEELLIMLPACDEAGALEVAERARLAVCDQPFQTSAGLIKVTVSVGVATTSNDNMPSLDELVRRADEALYRAKAQGRNCVISAT